MNTKPKLYFRGLNGLRFIAALLVVLSHAPTFLNTGAVASIYDFRKYSFFSNGSTAVDFFFVLSGFLITSLLLKEHDDTGNVSIKKFYTRRMLRIWPLYYFVVFLGFGIYPILANTFNFHTDPGISFTQLVLYIFFLPNISFIFGQRILLFPLWSIGVEEQFYLLVAPLVKYKKEKLVSIFIYVIIIKLLLNIMLHYYWPEKNISIFMLDLRFEVISIGCLGAIFLRSKFKPLLNRFFSYGWQIVMFGFLFTILLFNKTFENAGFTFFSNRAWNGIIMGFVFLYVILCISLNAKSIFKLDNKVCTFLGNISYGMYMYHVMVGFIVAIIAKKYLTELSIITATTVYYLLCVLLTIAVATTSYFLIEKRFLKVKHRFE